MRRVSLLLVASLGVSCAADNPTYYALDAQPDQAPSPDSGVTPPPPPPLPQTDSFMFSQKDMTAPQPDAGAPQPDAGPACTTSEFPFGNACYSAPGFSKSNLMDYATAVQVCAANNAKVVSVHGKAENKFIYELLDKLPFLGPSSAWIGLKRTGPGTRDFAWEDGTQLSFAEWAPGEPNNEEGDEDCTVMWGPGLKGFPEFLGKWNDAPCGDPGRTTVVCKRIP